MQNTEDLEGTRSQNFFFFLCNRFCLSLYPHYTGPSFTSFHILLTFFLEFFFFFAGPVLCQCLSKNISLLDPCFTTNYHQLLSETTYRTFLLQRHIGVWIFSLPAFLPLNKIPLDQQHQ